jgi:hypothetical protein
MNTYTTTWLQSQPDIAAGPRGPAFLPDVISMGSALVLAIVLPAMALIIGTAWMVSQPELIPCLQAMLWAGGFVFLALAIDSQKATVGVHLVTGVALPVLALLSVQIAPEIALAAPVLLASWLANAVLRS